MSQSDCGPVRHVDVCDDDDCGICESWRQEKQEAAFARLTVEDIRKTAERRRRDPEQQTITGVTAS
jgi:hypothetical protein